jgi:1,4-alpha-glucan branching enzyme
LPEGSWGQQGNHFTWYNADTSWMWPIINGAQRRMEEVVAQRPDAPVEALAQLARELFLLESSDWPFLVTTGQARQYAELRFAEHVERFNGLADQIQQGHVDISAVRALYERDKLFPDADARDFEAREGIASMPAHARGR